MCFSITSNGRSVRSEFSSNKVSRPDSSLCTSAQERQFTRITQSYFRQLDTRQYKPALTLIDALLTELKRLDDKMILTEVHLLESRVYRGIGNFPKSKVMSIVYML
jgi:hypothetical protein